MIQNISSKFDKKYKIYIAGSFWAQMTSELFKRNWQNVTRFSQRNKNYNKLNPQKKLMQKLMLADIIDNSFTFFFFFSIYFNSLKPNSKASTKGIMNGKKNKKYKNTFLLII